MKPTISVSGKILAIVGIVIVCLATGLLSGLIIYKNSFDRSVGKMLIQASVAVTAEPGDKPMAYDGVIFHANIELLAAGQRGYVTYQRLCVCLPVLMEFICMAGYTGFYLTDEEKQAVIAAAIRSLEKTSGEKFGGDVAKWQAWQEQKDRAGK